MKQPEPIFIGFDVKNVVTQPDWLEVPNVKQICSVSTCISNSLIERTYQLTHPENELGLAVSGDAAWLMVPELERNSGTLFAYQMYPVIFDEYRNVVEIDVLELIGSSAADSCDSELSGSFTMIGFDVVQFEPPKSPKDGYAGTAARFECSPLSCNYCATEHSVNDYCLLDTWDEALNAARDFADGNAEPPPYCILEVWKSNQE